MNKREELLADENIPSLVIRQYCRACKTNQLARINQCYY